MSSADASAALGRLARLWGSPSLFLGRCCSTSRAWGAASPLQCVPGGSRCHGAPLCHRAPWQRQPRGEGGGHSERGEGGCDHICGDTCADYGKWVNLPAAGGGLAGGGSWQGPARGLVRPQWPPLSPLSPGCQAVTRDMAKGRGSGTRPPARPRPAWARRRGSRWLRRGAVLSPPGTSGPCSREPAQPCGGGTVPPNAGVRACRTAARPPGPPAPCPERPRASCTCLPAVAEPARAVWGRAVPGTPFPGRRLPPQPRLKTTGSAASGCRGTVPLLPGSPWGAGMGHSGTPAMGHSRTGSPGPVVSCFHPEGWDAGWGLGRAWGCPLHGDSVGVCPQGAVGAARSVRGWWVTLAGTTLDFWDQPAPVKAPPVQPGRSGAGGGVAQLWPSQGPWRGLGHLFPQKNGPSGGGCGRCNRSGAFPA